MGLEKVCLRVRYRITLIAKKHGHDSVQDRQHVDQCRANEISLATSPQAHRATSDLKYSRKVLWFGVWLFK